MRIFLCLFLVLISFTLIVSGRACARCLGEGAFCGLGGTLLNQCLAGTKCTAVENGGAPICLPTVGTGDECSGLSYDPCPSLHFCHPDLKICQLDNGIADVNDGCVGDDNCKGDLTCSSGVCADTTAQGCDSVGCPIGSRCDQTVIPAVCVTRPVAGESCANGDTCFISTCIDDVCVEDYTLKEGVLCDGSEQCETGLACDSREGEEKCLKPLSQYSDTDPLKWGPECDGTRFTSGCYCNPESGVEQFIIESITVNPAGCKDTHKRYFECLKSNSCYQGEVFENSCLRKNCYSESLAYEKECQSFGYSIPRCSANDMALALVTILALLLL